jgi:heme/copper-type cytochrome/quinol oxidase subunit 3
VAEILINVMQAIFGLLFWIALFNLRHQFRAGRPPWPSREELSKVLLWLAVGILTLSGMAAVVAVVGPHAIAVALAAVFGALALYSLALPLWAYRRSRRESH